MKLCKNRTLLLSIRERPLPVLWLLAWLTPYLLFNIASTPHFHRSEFENAKSSSATLRLKTAAACSDAQASESDASLPGPEKQSPLHKAGDCALCQWQAGAQSEPHLSLPVPTTLSVGLLLSSTNTASSSSHARALRVRGPPSLS